MRVCIDARYLLPSGDSTYMANLVRALVGARSRHEIVLLRLKSTKRLLDQEVESIECPERSPLRQYWWVQRHLAGRLREAGIDLYHSLKHLGTFQAGCRQVLSMNSLAGYVGYFSGTYPTSLGEHVYWRYLGRYWLQRLDWLITCASFIGEHISARFQFPRERITCIPFGTDTFFSPGRDGAGSHAPGKPCTLLHVGNVLPVKNTLTLVRAFALLRGDFPELKLFICGDQSHPYFEKVRERAARLQVLGRVSFMTKLTREQLRDLYRSAAVFVLPSLHEGCPLALIEAMACGKPCVTSNRGGLPELGGGAVLRYEDATDPSALANLLARVLSDESLRASLSALSLRRICRYTWESTAARTLEVYDRVMSG